MWCVITAADDHDRAKQRRAITVGRRGGSPGGVTDRTGPEQHQAVDLLGFKFVK